MNEAPATSVVTKWYLLRAAYNLRNHRQWSRSPAAMAGRLIEFCLGNVDVAYHQCQAMYHPRLVDSTLANEGSRVLGMGAHRPNVPEIQELLRQAAVEFPRMMREQDPHDVPVTIGYLMAAAMTARLDEPNDPEVYAGQLIMQMGSEDAIRWAWARQTLDRQRSRWAPGHTDSCLDDAAMLICVAHCTESV